MNFKVKSEIEIDVLSQPRDCLMMTEWLKCFGLWSSHGYFFVLHAVTVCNNMKYLCRAWFPFVMYHTFIMKEWLFSPLCHSLFVFIGNIKKKSHRNTLFGLHVLQYSLGPWLSNFIYIITNVRTPKSIDWADKHGWSRVLFTWSLSFGS